MNNNSSKNDKTIIGKANEPEPVEIIGASKRALIVRTIIIIFGSLAIVGGILGIIFGR